MGETLDYAKFACPENATIKVDGVAASGVTVDNVPLLYNDMGRFFLPLISDSGVFAPNPVYDAADYNGSRQGTIIYYNPFYSHGIDFYSAGSATTIRVSNDLINWVTLSNGAAQAMPTDYKYYKYWKNYINILNS